MGDDLPQCSYAIYIVEITVISMDERRTKMPPLSYTSELPWETPCEIFCNALLFTVVDAGGRLGT